LAHLLYNLALGKHTNFAGVLDGGKSMRDHQNGSIFHKHLKGFLHAMLAIRIQL